jgi:adenylosuccinate synthase
MSISNVDICCGLGWGDEAKGKLVSELLKINKYNFVCRWSGGSNAGHTIFINDIEYHTHLIPAGIFHNILSIIGPDCYINLDDFETELNYLKDSGFDINLIKVSPRAHIITQQQIIEDSINAKKNTSTGKGICPCSRDKFGRIGTLVKDNFPEKYRSFIWDEKLFGNILCEGAQGFWLDINYGNYPYITSSYTLPYSACSLGFPPQNIRNIYGAIKIYDTRVGKDPEFELTIDNSEKNILEQIAIYGKEYGTTTGRKRGVNWLNLNKLVNAINISGCTHIIISKIDILEKIGYYRLLLNNNIKEFNTIDNMLLFINKYLYNNCKLLNKIIYSNNPKYIINLN